MRQVLRRRVIGVFASVTLLLFAVSGTQAHEGHDHKILGTVTTAAADRLAVKTRDGKEVTVLVTPATKVTRDKQPLKPEEIAVGTRVAITALMDKSVLKAKTVLVGKAGPAPAP